MPDLAINNAVTFCASKLTAYIKIARTAELGGTSSLWLCSLNREIKTLMNTLLIKDWITF